MVVRSDDIDGNDIIGTVTTARGAAFQFVAHATDEGEIMSSELDGD